MRGRQSACCFTGHRPRSFPWKYNEADPRCVLLKFRVKRQIIQAVKQDGVTHFLTGMALGVDTWAAEIVLSLRRKWSLTLEAVLPCKDQDIRWPSKSRERYQSILKQCDKVTLLQDGYIHDLRAVLCLRSDLCPGLVPFPADHEKPLLHYLPDLQLGPSDDVLPSDLYGRVLCRLPGRHGRRGLVGLGAMRDDVP